MDALATLNAVGRAVTRLERPDQLVSNLLVTGAVGPTLAGAVAGATSRDAGRIAVADADASLTYGGLWRSGQNLATVCRRAGMKDSAVVGLLADNTIDFVVGALCCSIIGADVVYLNTGFAPPQLAEVLDREQVTHVLVDAAHRQLVDTAVPAEAGIGAHGVIQIHVGEDQSRSPSDDMWGLASLRHPPSRRANRQVILTSGTTGTPKGARRSGVASAGLGFFRVVPVRSGDTVVIASPLFHAWGLSQLLLALTLGSTVRIADPADTDAIVEMLGPQPDDRRSADGLVVVPVVLGRLVAATDADQSYRGLRYLVSSGSALPIPVVRGARERFGAVLYNVYGSTEVALATIAEPADLHRFPTTAGRAVPGTRLALLDDDGERVSRGAIGRVFVDSGNAFDGYTTGGDKERKGSLVDTGDLGRMIGDLLFVEGRADDMIISGGENVFPIEVERFIEHLPGVAEVAVVGVDDPEFGQRLSAVIVADADGVTASGAHPLNDEAVRSAVRGGLARFKVPRDVLFVDKLPRTESGKVRRGLVIDLLVAASDGPSGQSPR